jgi:hypothetical protein
MAKANMGKRGAIAFGTALLASLGGAGCSTLQNPATIQPDLLAYNEAIAVSQREQLLLNIVRLRYRDTISFIQVTGVTTSYSRSLGGDLGSGLGIDTGPFDEALRLGGDTENSVRPLVEYEPLQGPGYAFQLLSPIEPSSLFLLTQSGWSAERLFLCCIARVAGVENARAAAGPTPDFVPDNAAFRALAADLRRLQLDGGLLVDIYGGGSGRQVVLTVSGDSPAALRVRTILGFAPDASSLPITDQIAEGQALTVRGRSLLGILAALSQTVEAPVAHGDLVTPTPAGEDWSTVIGGMFRVRSSYERPEDPAVAVQYRGVWFFIDDQDLQSKSTFDLVSHLFALQAARGQAGAPDPLIVLSPGS